MSSSSLKLLVFLGSVRKGRMGERVSQFVKKQLEERGHSVDIIDPLKLKLTHVEQPLHFYRNPAEIPPVLIDLNKQIKEADGFFAVSPEYNSAMGPALASLMDQCPPVSYSFRPSAIVTYSMGKLGGIRAAMQMREYLTELQTVHMSNMIVLPEVHKLLSDSGDLVGGSEAGGPVMKSVSNTITQFEWYANILKEGRKKGTPKLDQR